MANLEHPEPKAAISLYSDMQNTTLLTWKIDQIKAQSGVQEASKKGMVLVSGRH